MPSVCWLFSKLTKAIGGGGEGGEEEGDVKEIRKKRRARFTHVLHELHSCTNLCVGKGAAIGVGWTARCSNSLENKGAGESNDLSGREKDI